MVETCPGGANGTGNTAQLVPSDRLAATVQACAELIVPDLKMLVDRL